MLPFKEMLSGVNGSVSSKRVIGAICILYSMILTVTSMLVSPTGDIPSNVLDVVKEFLLVGAAMISAGLFEKKQL